MSLTTHVAISLLALSGAAFAAPASLDGTTLAIRNTIDCDCTNLKTDGYCDYGERLTLDDYTAYMKKYYPATDHYLLYSGSSVDQVRSFQQAGNSDYHFYDDFFDSSVSSNYLKQWPQKKDTKTGGPCFRPDDADASSMAISLVATDNVLVFGAIEYKKYPDSYFSSVEVENLHKGITNGRLKKITHLVRDAVHVKDVLATEDADGHFTFADGHSKGETNASGSYGDCADTLKPPTCDIPSGNSMIHH